MAEIEKLLNELFCGEDQRAESAALELIRLGRSAFDRLLETVADHNPDIRWWTLRTISGFDHPRVAKILIKALKDPSDDVKMCALIGLRQHPNKTAVDEIISIFDLRDQLLTRLAGDALIHIGTPAVPALINKTSDSDHHIRLQVIRVLAHIRDDRAIPVFFEIVKKGDSTMMEHWADIGLQNLGIGMAFFTPE